ncbi:unnamed protein product [Acanthoscelides obtectus]|uniref:Uncharacterized protein n=1 Tax=Acanthoscelides obtectus TaxID=200917 RepID=A0A9P0P023_ACAOB|nr:unnamed protein product [Acanthoscelides obtectus]CAK1669638.1 hypothetical protein AOBTE_LOCUS27119 [Acanthoscelides obtectus]
MTPAERQRQWRAKQKQDPEKYAEIKRKQAKRYQARKLNKTNVQNTTSACHTGMEIEVKNNRGLK